MKFLINPFNLKWRKELKLGSGIRATFMDLGNQHLKKRYDDYREVWKKQRAAKRVFRSGFAVIILLVLLFNAYMAFFMVTSMIRCKKVVKKIAPISSIKTTQVSQVKYLKLAHFTRDFLKELSEVGALGIKYRFFKGVPPVLLAANEATLERITHPRDYQVYKINGSSKFKNIYTVRCRGIEGEELEFKFKANPIEDDFCLLQVLILSGKQT